MKVVDATCSVKFIQVQCVSDILSQKSRRTPYLCGAMHTRTVKLHRKLFKITPVHNLQSGQMLVVQSLRIYIQPRHIVQWLTLAQGCYKRQRPQSPSWRLALTSNRFNDFLKSGPATHGGYELAAPRSLALLAAVITVYLPVG